MRIVILDGHTTNPGDLSWDPIHALGDCTVHDRTPPEEILHRAAGAAVVVTNKTVLDRQMIHALPDLRAVALLSTGTNSVDLAAARDRGIPVMNVPEYSTPDVAQATFALLLELTNRTGRHAELVRNGRWTACPDFCFWEGELVEIAGLTLGILGYGRIGRAVAAVGRAFGMPVIATGRGGIGRADDGTPLVELDTLFRESDVLSLHCPLTPDTVRIVSADRLALMRQGAYLLNTSRGGLVDEQALADALRAGRLAGAGLDVLSAEPPHVDNPLLAAPNCIITPHVAWAARKARDRLIGEVADNIRAFAEGRDRNVVNR
jgi:glycerate dehydrogenase